MSIESLFDNMPTERTFDALPEGKYQVEIEKVMIDEGGQYGPKLQYTLKISEETQFKNRKIWVNRKLELDTMWKVRQDLDALGFREVSSKNIGETLGQLIGKVTEVAVSYSPNPNKPEKPYQNVKFIEETTF